MNKYNEFMSHIRVDDEMHRRIMDAVSSALDEKENVAELPVRRKAKVSVIQILRVAAIFIIVAGGALFITTKVMSRSKSAEHADVEMKSNAVESVNEEIDAAIGGNSAGSSSAKSLTGGKNTFAAATRKASEATTAAEMDEVPAGIKEDPIERMEGSEETQAIEDEDRNSYSKDSKVPTYSILKKRDFKDFLPFKVKTVGTRTFGEEKINATVYSGEKGEKMIILSAKKGTDIVKAYFPDFKGVPALLQTESGQQFYGIDTSVGKKQQVSTSGPFDAVTWTKGGTSYMLVFGAKTDAAVFVTIMDKI